MTERWKNRELTAGISLWFTSVLLSAFFPIINMNRPIIWHFGDVQNAIQWYSTQLMTIAIKNFDKMGTPKKCVCAINMQRDRENFFGFASPKIARIFNYCRRFFFRPRITHGLIPLIHFSPEQRLQAFWTFLSLTSISLNRILETSKNGSSWNEGKSFRVYAMCCINWIDCWHAKGNSYRKRWTNGKWKFPLPNTPEKKTITMQLD